MRSAGSLLLAQVNVSAFKVLFCTTPQEVCTRTDKFLIERDINVYKYSDNILPCMGVSLICCV